MLGRRPPRPDDGLAWWEERIEAFVELRTAAAEVAARAADRAARQKTSTSAEQVHTERTLAQAHRALAEGAWYVLELSRQRPGLSTEELARIGAHVLDHWHAAADGPDRDRWVAADWALWMRAGATGSWRVRRRRRRSAGPEPAGPAA